LLMPNKVAGCVVGKTANSAGTRIIRRRQRWRHKTGKQRSNRRQQHPWR
jgi:hypothetical protein